MPFYERLDSILKARKIPHTQMISDLKLGKNTMFHWKSRGNIPDGKVMLKLSEYLGVSVDYLLCNDKYYFNDETSLLNEYFKLDSKQRESFLKKVFDKNSDLSNHRFLNWKSGEIMNKEIIENIEINQIKAYRNEIVDLIHYCWELENQLCENKCSNCDDINHGTNGFELLRTLIDSANATLMTINRIICEIEEQS